MWILELPLLANTRRRIVVFIFGKIIIRSTHPNFSFYRYQRVSPDCLPLSNGKKPSLRTATTSASKEDNCNNNIDNGRTIPNGGGFNGTSTSTSTCTSYDAGAKGLRFRSPSRNQDLHVNNHHLSHSGASCAPASPSPTSENNHHYSSQSQRRDTSPSPSPSPNRGDVLLQWGHKKRSRVSRTEIRSATVIITDDSSSSSVQGRQPINKLQRRALSATMPPPPLPPPHPSSASSNNNSSRASNLRNGVFTGSETSGFISSRYHQSLFSVIFSFFLVNKKSFSFFNFSLAYFSPLN